MNFNNDYKLTNDSDVLKIAIAGFLHDIGKLVEIDSKRTNEIYQRYETRKDEDLYCPKGSFDNYTHKHAAYTALALEDENLNFPDIIRDRNFGFKIKNRNNNDFENVRLIEVCARHHLRFDPNDSYFNEYVNIIKEADRLASAGERVETIDKIPPVDYFKTRLTSVLANVCVNDISNSYNEQYKLPLKELSATSIFPSLNENIKDDTIAKEEYEALVDKFYQEVKLLPFKDKGKEDLRLWFEAFDSLWLKYAGNIPEARAGNNAKDTSLYDHSRLTSAFASALYMYHKEKEDNVAKLFNVNLGDNSEREKEKFILVAGDFCGIQKFIFGDFSGESNKNAAKILRARSIMVSLYTELASSMICEKIGLPHTSVIFNAGGNFVILAPNTDRVKKILEEIRIEINNWLIKRFYGECAFVFACISASSNDFIVENDAKISSYRMLQIKLHNELDKEKLQKFSYDKNNFGVFDKYLDSFSSSQDVCDFCGKRPKVEDNDKCDVCDEFVRFGGDFVKEKYLVITNKEYKDSFGDYLRESNNEYRDLMEIFDGYYQVTFVIRDQVIKDLNNTKFLSKAWYYGINDNENSLHLARKFINGYVSKNEMDEVKTFEDIADCANDYRVLGINGESDKRKEDPINALGVLKADVDNLGYIMGCGLQNEKYTISRLSTISRQLNLFFSYYIPYYLSVGGDSNNDGLKNVYTVFGGGDDLFLIGPWNVMQDLVIDLDKKFKEYVGYNNLLHFSAGLFVCKDNIPVRAMGEKAEELLANAKELDERKNKFNIFEEIISFDEIDKFQEVQDFIIDLINNNIVSSSFLYSFNKFIDMSEQEKNLIGAKLCNINSYECMKWKALLAYQCSRNVKEKDIFSSDMVFKTLQGYISEYRSKLRIPLFKILYSIRGNNNAK